MSALSDFRSIVQAAIEAERAAPYDWNLLLYAGKLVALSKANPDERSAFEKEFVGLIETREPGGPFVEFCMHALRWDVVRESIETLHRAAISKPDWRVEPYYRHLLEAFDNDWSDAKDIYAAYFGNET
jgi:hypothetical protein